MEKESIHRIEKYLEGTLEEKESKLLKEELTDVRNKKEFEAYVRANHLADLSTKKFDDNTAFEKFATHTKNSDPKKSLIKLNTYYKYAAILVLAVMLGFFFFKDRTAASADLVQINVPNCEKRMIDLPDGTKVMINAGSILTYNDQNFLENRKVYLDGEAHFQVPKIKGRSFRVELNNDLIIKVLGTSFDVRSYEEDRKIEAALFEGSIQIISDSSEDLNTVLSPNSTAVYDKATHRLKILKNNELNGKVLVWKEDQFFFYHDYLNDIVNELNHSFDAHIDIADKELSDQVFTASFDRDDNLDMILHDLSITGNFKVDKTDSGHFKLSR